MASRHKVRERQITIRVKARLRENTIAQATDPLYHDYTPIHMDPDELDRWLVALRSGEYLQGHGRLLSVEWTEEQPPTRVAELCCLGVFCNLVHPDGWAPETVGLAQVSTFWRPDVEHSPANGTTGFPAMNFMQQHGLPEWFVRRLGKMNDGNGNSQPGEARFSFWEIAEVIEKCVNVESTTNNN